MIKKLLLVGSSTIILVVGVIYLFSWIIMNVPADGDGMIRDLSPDAEGFTISALRDCGVTDEGLLLLANKCPKVKVLAINGSTQITDKGLNSISAMSDLEYVSLERFARITEAGVFQLTALKKLQTLVVSNEVFSSRIAVALCKMSQFRDLGLSRIDGCEDIVAMIRSKRPDIRIEIMN